MNRLAREQKLKQKEVSGSKREAAIQQCRKINMLAASSSGKKVVVENNNKGEKKVKDQYDPSQEQLNNMIDEMVFMEV